MSRPQEPQRPFLSLGNPFKMMFHKGSNLSPKLMALLKTFEDDLAARMIKMKPESKDDVFSFSWMIFAMQLLSETHSDIKTLITELELPVYDWDDKWIDVYLDNSVKLLDICIALSSQLSHLSQGQLLLHCLLHKLDGNNSTEFLKVKSSIDSWRQHIGSKNARVENCLPIIDSLMKSLELPKVKNSPKGKVLMRALYGVKVETLFVCSVFISAFTGSDKKLFDVQVPNTHLWSEPYNELQAFVNREITSLVSGGRHSLVKELEEVEMSVSELYAMVQVREESEVSGSLQSGITELGKRTDKLSSGLDLLSKEVDGFFQIVLSGRDALLCNLRVSSTAFDSPKKYKMEEQLVR